MLQTDGSILNSKRRTYDKASASILPGKSGEVENCKQNPRTEKDSDNAKRSKSPGVEDMIAGMKDDMTDNQMKASLLEALDKRAKQKQAGFCNIQKIH